ncbi:MAG: outer membrane beta-barrel protein [Gammaproteobacteria bacterium]|jgi:hypothetical protein|nr:outer membrane beta-barrel protein [Zhongshania sp.]MBU0539658.1 outer membrane beta-barrel protein [Gammaproteobacteria bacterium]MBU1833826.1 outer membrane beta-barrel protein [Gammaproteobacteria bacterium]
MSRSFFNTALMCCAFFVSFGAQAQESLMDEDFTVHAVVTGGFTSGGDTLVEVEFDDGDDDELKAGGAYFFGFGAEFESADRKMAVQLSANYHFDSIDAENGEASFERYPIEVIIFGQGERNRFGVGLTAHLSPTAELKMDGFGRDAINFDTAFGLVLEYNYLIGSSLWVGARYTMIDYKKQNAFNKVSVDGNHIGLMVHFRI